MASAWRGFEEDLARRRDAGRAAVFWWRDDDAGGPTENIGRLLGLAAASAVPLALAVVPAAAQPALFRMLHAGVAVLQHGCDHRNRAGLGEKKTEFPAAEPEEEALARIAAARARLESIAGAWLLPVLAPPWNRLRGTLLARLPEIGLRGLSTYGPRSAVEPAPGLRQVNTHLDIVAWRAGRGFIGEDEALGQARRHLALQSDEPTGWLSHHAAHEPASWAFLERLFDVTRRCGAHWAHPGTVFLPATR
jgi:hypothetical protein